MKLFLSSIHGDIAHAFPVLPLTNILSFPVGQPDGVSVAQKEEASETMDTTQDEVAPQANGDKDEKTTSDANDISVVEEKPAEEKAEDASEVGFKKIFRFVGFKFTLKKDKVEEKDPVKLLTVKDKEGDSETEEPTKEAEEANVEETPAEVNEDKAEESNAEVIVEGEKAEITESVNEAANKEGDQEKEADATVPSPETTLSPFRKLFNTGLFSNLKKKSSVKKTKEEEEKEVAPEGEADKKEDAAATSVDVQEELKSKTEQEPQEPETSVQEKVEPIEEAKTGPSEEPQATQEDKIQPTAEEESGTVEVTSEPELLSSQEKTKAQGSPLKKLFTGSGLKKLSTKKQRTKKDTETKAESGEAAAEQLQSSTESEGAPKTDSGPSSPEESGEHAEAPQIESSQESQGEVSDGEKKKEGVIAWSSFKKLVTPKRRVKRSSESDEEAAEEKPAKTATLSSSESAPLTSECAEQETKEDQTKEETENTDKVESTEEPKKKMDTSVSWEALMCMGGPKKRARKTSDSDEEETKIEEDAQPVAEGEQVAEAATVASEPEGKLGSSGEHSERESAWDTLKRVVMPKPKAKVEEKNGESPEQVQSDGEAQKDETSFSFKKFLPGRRKKKADKHASDQGSSEDDSDTPAVVPLSEYNEQVETKEEAEAVAEAVAEAADAVQADMSADNRSPSWIPAATEDSDQHNDLSDIAEEADTAATSKSADTDVAEDEMEDEPIEPPKPSQYMGRRLSRAEVKPVAPTPSGETTPVPHGPTPDKADEVREGIDVLVSEIAPQTSTAVSDVPVEIASEKIEEEAATYKAETKTNTLLEPHAREEAMAICTGLGTREIAKVALEKPAMPIIESLPVIGNGLSTEEAVEDKPHKSIDAVITEDPLLTGQVHQIETTSLEPAVEIFTNDLSIIQTATEHHQPDIENIGIVTTVVEAEILQPVTTSENSPKTVFVDSITPTIEEHVCAGIIEVTEHTVEMKETEVEIQHEHATQEYTALNEVAEAICKTTNISVTKETEVAIPVNVPVEEVPMITNTKVLVGPSICIGVDHVDVSDVAVVHSKAIQVQETSECVSAVEPAELDVAIDQCQENVEQIDVEVQQSSDIEVQSMAITQSVIQEAVDKVSEDVEEPKKPCVPTASIPTPVQAEASTEKEIEAPTKTATITDVPNVLSCEKPPKPLCVAMEIIDLVPVEVANDLGALEEEEKTPNDLKQAVEVQVSDKTAILEEVKEIEVEKQPDEDQKQEEENKEESEVQEAEIKVVEEVEKVDEVEEPKFEAAPVEEKPKVLEIHMPVQVVLQTAQVMEDPSVEEEAEEFDNNGPVVKDTSQEGRSTLSPSKLSKVVEEPQMDSDPSEVTAASEPAKETKSSVKCAQVMAQVIEVIEEAVKEIDPATADNSAAS